MAEGMDVDPAPVVRDKKRFEVKKVGTHYLKWWSYSVSVFPSSGMRWPCGRGVSLIRIGAHCLRDTTSP